MSSVCDCQDTRAFYSSRNLDVYKYVCGNELAIGVAQSVRRELTVKFYICYHRVVLGN
jgi:hypothetical protein